MQLVKRVSGLMHPAIVYFYPVLHDSTILNVLRLLCVNLVLEGHLWERDVFDVQRICICLRENVKLI